MFCLCSIIRLSKFINLFGFSVNFKMCTTIRLVGQSVLLLQLLRYLLIMLIWGQKNKSYPVPLNPVVKLSPMRDSVRPTFNADVHGGSNLVCSLQNIATKAKTSFKLSLSNRRQRMRNQVIILSMQFCLSYLSSVILHGMML